MNSREYMRKCHVERQELGLCHECGKQPRREGKTRCKGCAIKGSQAGAAYYRRKRDRARVAAA